MADSLARPPAFVTSVVAGAIGVFFLLLGVATGSHLVFGLGIAAGVVSLVAALTWRSALVSAWHEDHRRPPVNPL